MRRIRRPRSRRQLLFLFLSGLLAIYGGSYLGNEFARRGFQPQAMTLLELPQPLADFALTDEQGKPFNAASLTGGWSLLLPGYTRHPEECAPLLGLAGRVYNRLAEWPELQRRLKVIMIGLDPEGDTPERLSSLLSPYGAPFHGASGSTEASLPLTRKLGWIAKRVDLEEGDYRMDHSTTLALVNPNGELVGLFTGLLDPATIAQDIQQLAATW